MVILYMGEFTWILQRLYKTVIVKKIAVRYTVAVIRKETDCF